MMLFFLETVWQEILEWDKVDYTIGNDKNIKLSRNILAGTRA